MAEHKSEKATPRRRQKAREKGQVARSKDLASILGTFAAVGVLYWQGQSLLGRWRGLLQGSLNAGISTQLENGSPIFLWSAVEVFRWMVPVMLGALTLSLVSSVAQGGFVFAGEALIPNVSRLSPVNKLKQMFSPAGLSGLLKSLLPFAAILYIGIQAIEAHWVGLVQASALGLHPLARFLFNILVEVSWKSGLVLLVWSGIDYALNWRKQESDLKMSKQELRDEAKETEGHPTIKGRIRRLQRQMRRSQVLQAAATATVVITNPTHFAVALRYEMDMDAPIVVAKGRDLIAQKIKEIAISSGIPIMENKPLAQALYKVVEVGQAIPSKLYSAVAEILVVVFRAQAEVRKQEAERRSKNASGEVI